jgi:hypothetical protein
VAAVSLTTSYGGSGSIARCRFWSRIDVRGK